MKFKIKRSKLDIITEIGCLVCLFGLLIYFVLNWGGFPDEIPGHYNAAGEIDRWGSKTELFILPVVSLVLYAFLSLLERFPQIWNTGVTITEENRERVYRTLKNMVQLLKLSMVIFFVIMSYIQSTAQSISGWFILFFMIIFFGILTSYLVKLYQRR